MGPGTSLVWRPPSTHLGEAEPGGSRIVVQERRVDLGFLVAWIGFGKGMRSDVTPRQREHWAARPPTLSLQLPVTWSGHKFAGERPRPLPIYGEVISARPLLFSRESTTSVTLRIQRSSSDAVGDSS